jgi:drug/metabolite transporter (DMT)-like permease
MPLRSERASGSGSGHGTRPAPPVDQADSAPPAALAGRARTVRGNLTLAAASAQTEQHAMRGILLMLLAVGMWPFMDTMAKLLACSYPVTQVALMRYVFHAAFMLLIFAPRMGARLVRSRHPGLQVLRGLALAGSTLCFFSALKVMPLAETSSISQLGPILTTVGAVLMLRERVGATRWIAVAAGFAGVLLVIRPGTAVFTPYALFPLGTAVCMTGYNLLTRRLAQTEEPIATLFYSALVGTAALAMFLPAGWKTPESFTHLAMMAATGFIGGASHLVLIKAYECAPASKLALFSYTQMFWMLLLGYLVFGDFPDGWSLIGIAIVIGSALYVATHQHLLRRAAVKRA